MQLQTAIEAFDFHCRYEKNLSTITRYAYQTDLRQFKAFITEPIPHINSINKEKLKQYVQHLFSLELKAKTIKRKVATLKSFFNYLEHEEVIDLNPFYKLRLSIKEPQRLPSTIKLRDIKKLFRHLYSKKEKCSNPQSFSYKCLVRDIAVLEVLFATGIRVSEACGLTQGDVDLSSGRLRIIGKGNKERSIQICEKEVINMLKEYRTLFHEQSIPKDAFFINRTGKPLSDQSIRLLIVKYTKETGMGIHITPHMFRHSFATLLLEAGVDIRYIQHMLGHASISTTQIYTRVNSKIQRKLLATKHPRRDFNLVS